MRGDDRIASVTRQRASRHMPRRRIELTLANTLENDFVETEPRNQQTRDRRAVDRPGVGASIRGRPRRCNDRLRLIRLPDFSRVIGSHGTKCVAAAGGEQRRRAGGNQRPAGDSTHAAWPSVRRGSNRRL